MSIQEIQDGFEAALASRTPFVVRAARLCGVCRGGQVLLSETTRALVSSKLPSGVALFPLGERHLKDIDEPERVYELEIEGIAQPPAPDGELPQPADQSPEHPSPSEAKSREQRWEEEFERSVEDLVQRSMDSALAWGADKLGRSKSPEGKSAEGVNDIAARADDLVKRIERKIRRAQGDMADGENG